MNYRTDGDDFIEKLFSGAYDDQVFKSSPRLPTQIYRDYSLHVGSQRVFRQQVEASFNEFCRESVEPSDLPRTYLLVQLASEFGNRETAARVVWMFQYWSRHKAVVMENLGILPVHPGLLECFLLAFDHHLNVGHITPELYLALLTPAMLFEWSDDRACARAYVRYFVLTGQAEACILTEDQKQLALSFAMHDPLFPRSGFESEQEIKDKLFKAGNRQVTRFIVRRDHADVSDEPVPVSELDSFTARHFKGAPLN